MALSGGTKPKRLYNVLPPQAIPLKQTGKAMSLVYTAAIAHQLATQPHHAATIAAQLVDTLLHDDLEPLPQGVTPQATAVGLIHFEVGNRAIATWLDQLLTNTLPPQTIQLAPSTKRERQILLQSAAIFEAQYAHARCCSLLRLAHREALIQLEGLVESPIDWRFDRTVTFHWLTAAGQLTLNHAADRCLLVQLFEALDCLSDSSPHPTPRSLARSAQAVSHAFQGFHRTHPLWRQAEDISTLVTAQLGLLMATQRVLYWLLADGLGVCPAIEL